MWNVEELKVIKLVLCFLVDQDINNIEHVYFSKRSNNQHYIKEKWPFYKKNTSKSLCNKIWPC